MLGQLSACWQIAQIRATPIHPGQHASTMTKEGLHRHAVPTL